MSMSNVEYQGYGVDLGDVSFANLQLESVWQIIIENLDELSEMTGYMKDVITATPCNTNSFKALVIIPALIPIAVEGVETKLYTEKEAQLTLSNAIKEMVNTTYTNWNAFSNMQKPTKTVIALIQKSIPDFVANNIDYSYNHDWSDLIQNGNDFNL